MWKQLFTDYFLICGILQLKLVVAGFLIYYEFLISNDDRIMTNDFVE